jgi:hypothetical protein
MKRLLLSILLSTGTAFAQSPFDGTWVIRADTIPLPQTPEAIAFVNGTFSCAGCIEDIKIKADGRDYKVAVADPAYCDTASVRALDSRTVEIVIKKAGRTMFTETDAVSADTNTLSQIVKDTTESQTVTIETTASRVKPIPAGSHTVSGSWRVIKYARSKNGSTINYRCTPDSFSAATPLGEKFDAKFDGKFYPVEDDPGHTMVAAKLVSPNTVILTSKRNRKVAGILRLSVAGDGKTIHVTSETKDGNVVSTYEMEKQLD